MSARRTDGMNRYEHPRTDRPPVVDGVAQTDVDVIARADVADGCEASLDCFPRECRREDGLLGRMAHQRLKIVEVEVLLILFGEVNVRIDQAGEKRRVAE